MSRAWGAASMQPLVLVLPCILLLVKGNVIQFFSTSNSMCRFFVPRHYSLEQVNQTDDITDSMINFKYH